MNFKSLPLATVLIAGLCASPAAHAEIIKLSGHFVTEHNATSHPLGKASARLDTTANTLNYRFSYGHLTGPVTAIHLHGPASETEDAGVLAPIEGPYKGHLKGELKLTPEQVKAVQDGKSYINLHTSQYAEGEARAQLEP